MTSTLISGADQHYLLIERIDRESGQKGTLELFFRLLKMNREQLQYACDLVNRNNERTDATQKCKVGKLCPETGRCIPQSHKCESKSSHSGWLIYFEGRRTPVAVSASDRSEAISKAKVLKKRGGEGVVSARHANEQERAQAAKGKWIRTGPNGEKPGESKLRGQGPRPKAYKGDEGDSGES